MCMDIFNMRAYPAVVATGSPRHTSAPQLSDVIDQLPRHTHATWAMIHVKIGPSLFPCANRSSLSLMHYSNLGDHDKATKFQPWKHTSDNKRWYITIRRLFTQSSIIQL